MVVIMVVLSTIMSTVIMTTIVKEPTITHAVLVTVFGYLIRCREDASVELCQHGTTFLYLARCAF
jgi:hypothetical protein